MTDQAETLRKMMLRRSPTVVDNHRPCGLVLVFGCLPGIGTTTISWQWALRWRRRGWPVAWVDANPYRPGAAVSSAIVARLALADVLEDARTLREAWGTGPCGVPVLAGTRDGLPRTRFLQPGDAVVEQLQRAARQQFLVVDAAAPAELAALVPFADQVILVTTPDSAGVTAAYGTLKQIMPALQDAICWLLLARSVDLAAAKSAGERVALAADRHLNLALETLGTLPYDAALVPGEGKAGIDPLRTSLALPLAGAMERCAGRLETALLSSPRRALGEIVV